MCNEEEEEGQLQKASKYTMSQEEEEGQLQNASKYTMLQEEEVILL